MAVKINVETLARLREHYTKGILLPESAEIITPSNVIYQTAGDGMG